MDVEREGRVRRSAERILSFLKGKLFILPCVVLIFNTIISTSVKNLIKLTH